MTQTFLKKDGDIREVLRTMFKSPEFWAPEAYRAKGKNAPLEFVVSAVARQRCGSGRHPRACRHPQQHGMMPYGMMPPTGYSMKADTWGELLGTTVTHEFRAGAGPGKDTGS